MAESAILVSHTRLHEFIVTALVAMKMSRPIAEVTAGLMVRTDLRGVDSHGIGMLPRYHELWQAGYIRMDAEPSVVRDEVATGLFDGQKGLGHYVSTRAMQACIEKARTYGLGMVAVRNSGHYGAAANYSMMALEHDMIGLSMTNSPYVAMVPTFGRKAMLSTNPISFAAPAGRHAPFVLDMATTTVAIGKLSVASRWNTPIPSGWALDDAGTPTTDPFVALKHRLVTPLGGTRDLGSHKGYGLGMMVDILSGVMSGAVYGDLFYRSDRQERRVQDVGHDDVRRDQLREIASPRYTMTRPSSNAMRSSHAIAPSAGAGSSPDATRRSSRVTSPKSRRPASAASTSTRPNLPASSMAAPDCMTRSSGPSRVTL